ncbi:glycoside hydrolase [Streptomyces sp. VRA16 Mangrove soil]|uniref:glycoside hydrolase family 38 N-terminal domain-containing protein n=1 Tax=Streptomyces sp. VRA16 Mangrove soil TaxID=2817434 RepID=UPI001A9D66AC|nr:glycoside hydrolase [Streptomyces sp. VRA16 Mangrove soil]MBO1335525.1 glycoside hydrolase [Streptomyces sp. VRA16 Mangrove soil]
MDVQDSGIQVAGVMTPALFAGPEREPLQVVRVRVRRTRPVGPFAVSVSGPSVATPRPRFVRADTAEAYAGVDAKAELAAAEGESAIESVVEVAVRVSGAAPGTLLPVRALVAAPDGRELCAYAFTLPVAEPGWTVRLVPHFHYDPMWWNTQAAYTALWDTPPRTGEAEKGWEYTGVPAFTLVPLHLQQARDDPAYRFVLSEIDYLKPFWDTHPEHRDEIRQLIAEGRLEIVGGTYNEPSTNLTSAETTARSAVHGLGFHRGVLGAAPRTAWQLDVFGHDPSFPALMRDAGLDSAVLARGPHHQWGPMMDTWGEALRPPTAMQLPAEYDWLGPDGTGLLLHYLPAHYSAGWFSHKAPSADAAAEQLLALYELLRTGAATRNVLIPMGTDFSWPHPWGLDVQHAWNRRYTWPRLEHAGPREHFAAVRAELAARGERPLPVTREMGPVYTGKDVTYADVKQAHRAAENLVQEAETFAALAHGLGLTPYPDDALDKAWRHLLHAAHHDAVTGTFSDQVYLDLLPTWREAAELAAEVRESALAALTSVADTSGPAGAGAGAVAMTVFNPVSWTRTDVVRTRVALADLADLADLAGVAERADLAGQAGGADLDVSRIGVRDDAGGLAPVLVEHVGADEVALAFLATDLPPLGHRTWWLVAADAPLSGGWEPEAGTTAANETFLIEADPARGGGLSRVTDLRGGHELLTPGEVDELVVQDEYAAHPFFEEGPWHLLPKGPGTGSGSAPADTCVVERSPLGARIVATGRTGPARWTRTTTLWNGLDRVELTTRVDEFTGSDQLMRLRVPVDVPGALPVAETAAAAVGRGFAFPETDTGTDHTRAPWTLDSPCLNWFALSSTLRATLTGPDGAPAGERALGAGEIVLPDGGLPGYGAPLDGPAETAPDPLRDLVTALVRQGVTTTPTRARGPRWGDLAVDSSLPDFRIAIGGPEVNAFTAAVLDDAGPAYADAVRAARAPLVWVPARTGLREAWVPGCDLTGVRDLPVAVLTGDDLPAALAALALDVAGEGRVGALDPAPGAPEAFEDRTVALLVRGTPGFAVDTRGRLHSSLLRSCSGRPSGAWMDPPRRTAPDGSSFQLQHWTHVFEHALVASPGDWRRADLVRRGREFNQPLTVVSGAPHPGTAPAARSLLTVEPADRVLVETVKRADGQALAVRLRETHGRDAGAALTTVVPVRGIAAADLLDAPRADAQPLALPGHAYTTVRLDTGGPLPPCAPRQEEVRPRFSRYWLHNTGTSPLGNAPHSLTVSPSALTAADGGSLRTEVVLTSNTPAGEGVQEYPVTVRLPDGWRASWTRDDVRFPAGGHVALPLVVDVPHDASSGDHLVLVEAADVQDCLTVTVPGTDGPPPGLDVHMPRSRVRVAPGGVAEIHAVVRNALHSPVHGEAIAVSPYGSWGMIVERTVPLRVPDRGETEVVFRVRPLPDTPPGVYWVLIKAVCLGRSAYGTAVAVTVDGADAPHAAHEGASR